MKEGSFESQNKSMIISPIDIVMGCFFIYQLTTYCVRGDMYGTFLAYLFPLCSGLYFVFKRIMSYNKIRHSLTWVLVLWSYIEIGVCFAQMLNLINFSNSSFIFGGTFGNPGALAAFMSVLLPIFVSETNIYKKCPSKRFQYNCLSLCICLLVIFILLSNSRGAWIASLAGCFYVLKMQQKYKCDILMKKIKCNPKFCGVCIILCIGILIALYLYKHDSAFGRLFIWKVIINESCPNVFWGDGIGAFSANYGKWQAEYFLNNYATAHEKFVADYVVTAYNEFIEIFVEQGLCGVLIMFSLAWVLYYRKMRYTKNILIGAKGTLLSVFVLCFVSYPFAIPAVMIVITICISILGVSSGVKLPHTKIPLIFSICISTYILVQFGCYIFGKHLLYKGQSYMVYGNNIKAKEMFLQASNFLQNDGNLMYNQGLAEYLDKHYNRAVCFLKNAQRKSSDPNIYIQIADCYQLMGDINSALMNYNFASKIVPNRLYPKYKIFSLLRQEGRIPEAIALAKEIIETPVKTPTIYSKEIKEEALEYIKDKAV